MISLPPESKRKSNGLGRSEVVDVYCFADGLTYKGKKVKEKLRYERELDGFSRVSGTNTNNIGGGGKKADAAEIKEVWHAGYHCRSGSGGFILERVLMI